MRSVLMNKLAGHGANRLVIGLDGLSRSGKTTYVKSLLDWLDDHHQELFVFHLDDHIEPRSKRYNTGNEEWYEYYYNQWNVDYLRENLFGKAHSENEIELPYYDPESDSQTLGRVRISNQCVIIIEGVFLQRPEWRDNLDFVIYLDCPREIRFQREGESTRSNIDKFRNRYWKAEDFYLESVRPQDLADIIVKN